MTSIPKARPVRDDEISGDEKLRRVGKLVKELQADFIQVNFLPHERNAAMEQLKVFGRNPDNADPIFTREGIEILTHHAFHSPSPTTSKAALECLANALLLRPNTRQIFVDLGYSEKAVARLKKPKKDDEFLMCRIIFLTSYGTTQSFMNLIDKHKLADFVNDNIERHAKVNSKSSKNKQEPSQHDDQALSETLKLLFNITHFCPSRVKAFSKSIANIMKILNSRTTISPPLKEPVNYLINALMNLDLEEKKAVATSNLKPCVQKLVEILDSALRTYPDHDLDSTVVPLLTLLKRLAKVSPNDVKNVMRTTLLPDPKKHGENSANPYALQSRLLKYLTTPISTQTYDGVSGLFFELADGDMEKFMGEFGLGFSSGFLLTRNLQLPSMPSPTKYDAASTRSSISSNSVTSTNSLSTMVRQSTASSNSEGSPPSVPPKRKSASNGRHGRVKSEGGQKLMMVWDHLKPRDIHDYNDPVMKRAARDLVVELDSDDE